MERIYQFKKSATGAVSDHCTYCPKPANQRCGLACAQAYDTVVKEREADGVIVNDDPGELGAHSVQPAASDEDLTGMYIRTGTVTVIEAIDNLIASWAFAS
jgi:hypothetical protein